ACIIGYNRPAQQLFGYSLREVVGRRVSDLLLPEALGARHQALIERYITQPDRNLSGMHRTVTARRADGSILSGAKCDTSPRNDPTSGYHTRASGRWWPSCYDSRFP